MAITKIQSESLNLADDFAFTGTITGAGLAEADIKTLFNASGSAPVYACRAWVNFNGSGTVAIRDSGNVSSITDNGIGDYTTNFTTAMPDDDYAVVFAGTIRNNASGNGVPQVRSTSGNWTTGEGAMLTTSVRSLTRASSGSDVDTDVVCVTIFR